MYSIKYSQKSVKDIKKLKAANLSQKAVKIISMWSHYEF